jgi:integrase/recombinase XerD
MRHMAWKNRDQKKIEVPKGVKNSGAYVNLMNQINKVTRHSRQNSFKTRDAYYQHVERFSRHLAARYNLQKFNNIGPKHVASYVSERQKEGISGSTIKTELSAIRFYHDQFPEVRYRLPENKDLNLEKRSFGGVDRTWSQQEYTSMVNQANQLGRHDVANIMKLARLQGLRIHEVVRIDRSTAEQALRHDTIQIRGKGGLERTVPLRPEGRYVLENAIKEVDRGQKLFVRGEAKTHEVIKSVQNFIEQHRDKFADLNRESNLTAHGLRHSYAREEYEKRLEEGVDKLEAREEVSALIGHSRDDVTRIYIND